MTSTAVEYDPCAPGVQRDPYPAYRQGDAGPADDRMHLDTNALVDHPESVETQYLLENVSLTADWDRSEQPGERSSRR